MFLLRFDYLQLESIIGNILDKKSKKEKEEKDDERGRSHGRRRKSPSPPSEGRARLTALTASLRWSTNCRTAGYHWPPWLP